MMMMMMKRNTSNTLSSVSSEVRSIGRISSWRLCGIIIILLLIIIPLMMHITHQGWWWWYTLHVVVLIITTKVYIQDDDGGHAVPIHNITGISYIYYLLSNNILLQQQKQSIGRDRSSSSLNDNTMITKGEEGPMRVYVWGDDDDDGMMIKDVGDRVYKLREKELDNPQASHNQFLAEVLIHKALLIHHWRTNDIYSAHIIFVPYYGRLTKGKGLEAYRNDMAQATLNLIRKSIYLNKKAKILIIHSSTRDWPSIFTKEIYHYLLSDRVMVAALEGSKGDLRPTAYRFNNNKDISIPYVIHYQHIINAFTRYTSIDDVIMMVNDNTSNNNKDIFIEMTCSATHRYRKYFAKVLNNAPELKGKNTHIIVNSLINSSSITRDNPKYQDGNMISSSMDRMARAVFCLVPRGITSTSRRLYEAIINICIPIILSNNFRVPFTNYHYHNIDINNNIGVVDSSKFIIKWNESDIKDLPMYLVNNMTIDIITTMQIELIKVRSRYVYNKLPYWQLQPDATHTMLQLIRNIITTT